MKKTNPVYLIIVSLLFKITIYAQVDSTRAKQKPLSDTIQHQKEKKVSFKKFDYKKSTGINVLYAIPIGDFGKKELDKGGFAMPGWGVSFDSRNHLGYGFSFVSYSSYSWINLDSKVMGTKFTGELGLRTEIDGGQHRPFFTTVGLAKDFYLHERILFGFSATAGLLYTSFKPFTIKVYDNTNQVVYDDILRYDADFAFAYGFSTQLNFMLIKNVLAFHVEIKYNAANTDTYLRSNYFSPIRSNEKMQFLNFNTGFVFFSK